MYLDSPEICQPGEIDFKDLNLDNIADKWIKFEGNHDKMGKVNIKLFNLIVRRMYLDIFKWRIF